MTWLSGMNLPLNQATRLLASVVMGASEGKLKRSTIAARRQWQGGTDADFGR